MAKKKLTYEEAVGALEDVLTQLDRGEVNLEESIKLFKEGLAMVETCHEQLTKAEGDIKILLDNTFVDYPGQ